MIGLPLAYLASRRPTLLNLGCLQAAYAGYVLPGPVAALAVLVLFTKLAPVFYGSVLILIVAYVIHFLPAGLQSLEPALQQMSPNLEEVARTLGLGVRETWRRVTLPLVRNGFVVAWVLMFLQTMKELPATLLLRPVGFDTLAIRVWMEASEEYFQLAAPSALLIVLLSLPGTGIVGLERLARRVEKERDSVTSDHSTTPSLPPEATFQGNLFTAGLLGLGAALMSPAPTKPDVRRSREFRSRHEKEKFSACSAPQDAGKPRFCGRSPDLNRFAPANFSSRANSSHRRT